MPLRSRPALRPHRGVLAALLGGLLGISCAPGSHDVFRVLPTGACPGADGAGAPGTDLAPTPVIDPALAARAHQYFKLSVLDDATRAPIEGARLALTNGLTFTSDVNGVVAFYEPGLMNTDVWFTPSHPAYDVAADVLKWKGKAFHITEGGAGELLMTKVSDAASPVVDDFQSRLLASPVPSPSACFSLRAIDRASRRGVPLVFATTPDATFVTDSQGVIADCLVAHVGTTVTYAVTSDGYSFPTGATTLLAAAGTTAVLELDRQNVAERLYRTTGLGVYRDSVLLGLTTPVASPTINGLVMVQDTANAVTYRGGIFWIWGSTARASYPLGNLVGSGATSSLPAPGGGLDPRLGVDTTYFVGTDGFSRGMMQNLPPLTSPIWLGSLMTVPDAQGTDQLFVAYTKPAVDLSLLGRGLAKYDDARQLFVATPLTYAVGDAQPTGQPVTFHARGATELYFGGPVRVPATAEALGDATKYETWTATTSAATTVASGADGLPDYGWRSGAPATTLAALEAAGFGVGQRLDGHVADAATNASVALASTGAGSWSARRGRFIKIVEQQAGATSFRGEIWYLEADTPLGPWVYARKILTHDDYGFYALWLHPHFEQQQGRFVFFEGTYSKRLEGTTVPPTPRYDDNALMYRVDLDDARLALPVPVYADATSTFVTKPRLPRATGLIAAVFEAPERPADGTVAVAWSGPACAARQLVVGATPPTPPVFYGVAAGDPTRPAFTVPLYDHVATDGGHAYSLDAAQAGSTPAADPLVYVWPSPLRVKLPVTDYLGDAVADAGPDQCLVERRVGAGGDVTLDASRSSSAAGAITAYAWTRWGEACPFAADRAVTVHVATGTTAFQLTVTDAAGNVATDDVIVGVASKP